MSPSSLASPVDCEYQDWAVWTSCSVTCGGGTKSRRKFIKTNAQNGGRECDNNNLEKIQCNTQICPTGMRFKCVHYFIIIVLQFLLNIQNFCYSN